MASASASARIEPGRLSGGAEHPGGLPADAVQLALDGLGVAASVAATLEPLGEVMEVGVDLAGS